jgi:hypothetical protein
MRGSASLARMDPAELLAVGEEEDDALCQLKPKQDDVPI